MGRLKLSEKSLTSLVRRVMAESGAPRGVGGAGRGLACWVTVDGRAGGKVAFIWDPSAAIASLESQPPGATLGEALAEAAESAALGIVGIKPPDEGECWGAWQVSYSAKAPGAPRGIIYPVAYAISPLGRLVSDRYVTSDSSSGGGDLRGATEVWKNAFDATGEEAESARLWGREPSGRGRWRLDEPPPRNKTATGKDDCLLNIERGKDHLNWAYGHGGLRKHRAMLSAMRDANDRAESAIVSWAESTESSASGESFLALWREALDDACFSIWKSSATFD